MLPADHASLLILIVVNVAQISRQAAKTFSTTLSPAEPVAVAHKKEAPVANICSFVIQDCCRWHTFVQFAVSQWLGLPRCTLRNKRVAAQQKLQERNNWGESIINKP